jgi:hypothetical protein
MTMAKHTNRLGFTLAEADAAIAVLDSLLGDLQDHGRDATIRELITAARGALDRASAMLADIHTDLQSMIDKL